MKKTIATVAVVALALVGCGNNNNPVEPPVTPTATSSNSTNTSAPATEPPVKPTNPQEPDPTKTTNTPEPKPSVTISSDAGTPANQFAARWGLRYPNITEYVILKAANGMCAVIVSFDDWESSALARKGIDDVANSAGISQNDAFEFAQDADQNYCSSVSNPT